MSKNFVREIDGIKNINKQDFNTNKVNDLLSTRAQNFIRTENRGYHCLTDNVKSTNAESVTYNNTRLITVDNSKVTTTNQNTINASGLVNALNEKDQQIQVLSDKIDNLNSENKKEPQLHYVSEFAGDQFFNMQTTQTYNFNTIEIFTRVAYRLVLPNGSDTQNFAYVLEYGATNFNFNDYDIKLKKYYNISGYDDLHVEIDGTGKGLDFTPGIISDRHVSGEIFIKFTLAKKQQTAS